MKTFIKVLWVIAGAALILGGCFAFASPLASLHIFQVICGSVLLVTGIISIIAYCASHRIMLGAGWILAEGIMSALMGGLILVAKFTGGIIHSEYVSSAVFSIFFAMIIAFWLMFSGVNQLTRSFDLHKLGARGWGWGTIWGIICILGAIAVFCSPIVAAVGTITFLLGFALIVGGISVLSRCFSRDIED